MFQLGEKFLITYTKYTTANAVKLYVALLVSGDPEATPYGRPQYYKRNK